MDFENLIKFGDIGIGIDNCKWIIFRYSSRTIFFLDNELNSSEVFIYWLPLLEYDYHDVNYKLAQFFLTQNLSTSCINQFPIDELIVIGLESFSLHWINCSLNWLEQITEFQSNKIIRSLKDILDDKKIKTPLKHRIYKILRNSKLKGTP